MIARGMGLPSEDVARIRAAAAVHDVGKLRTPKAVLNKPGRLTDAEFEVIKRHPVDGAEMVAALGDAELTRIVRHHHERLDGAGYPDGLHGDEIPLGARIIAVADTFDAITSARPYRDAAPHQKAIDILREEAGTQLDPDAVRAFLAYYSGRRPMVVWTVVMSSLRRLVAWLSGDPASAATISASKVAATTAATAVIGAAAGAAPVPAVHHAPPRRAIAHVHAALSTHGATAGLRRHAVSVAVPGGSRAAAGHSAKPQPVKTRRGAARAGGAHRPGAQPDTGKRRRSRAPSAGRNSAPRAPAATATPTGPSTSASHGQSGAAHGVSSAGVGTPSASGRGSTSQSQGSGANGNAYGHGKTLGGGHGKGLAKGHGDSGQSPAASSRRGVVSDPPPTVPAANPSNTGRGSSHGNGDGQGNQNSQGNSHADGNGQGNVSASAVVAPSAGAGSEDNGNGDGNGNGNGQGDGHDGHGTNGSAG
jgi:hypothetical protein